VNRTIARVIALSTGSVRIRPEHIASNGTPELWWLLTSRRWSEPLPINVYVIEHRDGLVLFDAGQDRASVTDVDYFPKALRGIYGRLARFEIAEDQTLPTLLERAGYAMRDVCKVIVSHLHQDHIGALAQLSHAEFYVSEPEWKTLHAPFPELSGVLRAHIDPTWNWKRIAFGPVPDAPAPFASAYDVMGDGSLVLVPTPGHTPGSMSLLVRDGASEPLLLVGDLTYSCELLHQHVVPGVGKARELHAVSERVLELATRLPGLEVLAAHDPSAATRLAKTALGGSIRPS
jgi:glyoxylase-like metal-dependent hydrolase (beta-lactamase superfamily II)